MSFTTDVKSEIATSTLNACCQKAQCAALIQLCSSMVLSSQGMQIQIKTENATTAKRIWILLKELYKCQMELSVLRKMNLKKNNIYAIKVVTLSKEILNDLGLLTDQGLQDHPLRKMVGKECCARAYLSGAFMATGSVNSPHKSNYHLEIVTQEYSHALFVQKLMFRFDLPAKHIERRKQHVVYLKASDKISDFLRLSGANNSVLDFEDIRIQRDFHNSLTRLDNCEVANEMKTLQAGKKQVEYIEILQKAGVLDNLEDKLKDVAYLRIEFPEASLNELCNEYELRTGAVMSKSGMKHRLTKIMEASQKV